MGIKPDIDSRASLALLAVLALTAACTKESVTAVTVTEVSVSPPAVSTPEGEAVQFSATVRDENNRSYSDAPVEWSSDDESVVRIDEDGTARAVSPGSTRVRARFHDASGEAQITVVSTSDPLLPPLPPDPGGGGSDDPPCVPVPLLPDLCVKP